MNVKIDKRQVYLQFSNKNGGERSKSRTKKRKEIKQRKAKRRREGRN